jgi:post-GPI attachment to proteins factor 3
VGDRPLLACRRRLLTFIVAVNTCVLLELLDFPPLAGLVDAHSLWHAATIPLTTLWYSFVELDCLSLQSPGKSV